MLLPAKETGGIGQDVTAFSLENEDGPSPNFGGKMKIRKPHRRRYTIGASPPFRKGGRSPSMMWALLVVLVLLAGALPLTAYQMSASVSNAQSSSTPAVSAATGTDVACGTRSTNLTVTTSTSKYKVLTEEYAIVVDYSTAFIEYQIRPYFTTDYIAYKRAKPQYAGDGTVDQNGVALDSVAMKVSSWGKSGSTVWFKESCAEFSILQSFNIYRDYFELNVTYSPGSKKVLTTYYFDLHAASGSRYGLMSDGHINRYIPGIPEDTPKSNGIGGWYPKYQMFAPAADLRVPGKNLGVEWGFEDTVAYLYSPLWLSGGVGGASVMSLKYTSINSVVPNIGLGTSQTFHMFVRPYQYTDGKDRGYDVGYASWVSPKIAAKFGNHNTPVFPLTVMDLNNWGTSERTWVEASQVKVASQSNNPSQINWHYKYARTAHIGSETPSTVPTSWQIMQKGKVPLTFSDGRVVCNPLSGPYTTKGTYRYQLINNDPFQSWWISSKGVFWDGITVTTSNSPLNDYTERSAFLFDGYLALVKESYASGYWDYVIANSFTGFIHLAIAADLTCIEGYEPSSVYSTNLTKNVWSTMNFVNNIPAAYRPKIVVYQNYATASANDQKDVYSVLFGAAKYGFLVDLMSYDSFDSQKHNLKMAEDMFLAMGCTRDSDVRKVKVDTLDLAIATTISTSASMVVMKGTGMAYISSTSAPSVFKLTNLLASTRSFDLSFTSSDYYSAGINVQATKGMTYTTDGKAVFHGSIGAEKTGEVTKNPNLKVKQTGSGSVTVSLVSFASTGAKVNLASTGGTTTMDFFGLKASTTFKVIIDGTQVTTVTSRSDGSLSLIRSFGTSDVLELRI
jgi:hypothetical protein